METQPLESSVMLAGLTRGLWKPSHRYLEPRDDPADAATWRNALLSEAQMPGITRGNRKINSARMKSDRS